MQKLLQYGCNLIGMLRPAWAHDVRRGAAVDIAHLAMPLRGGSPQDAAMMPNHSTQETSQGLTRKYVGHSREDS